MGTMQCVAMSLSQCKKKPPKDILITRFAAMIYALAPCQRGRAAHLLHAWLTWMLPACHQTRNSSQHKVSRSEGISNTSVWTWESAILYNAHQLFVKFRPHWFDYEIIKTTFFLYICIIIQDKYSFDDLINYLCHVRWLHCKKDWRLYFFLIYEHSIIVYHDKGNLFHIECRPRYCDIWRCWLRFEDKVLATHCSSEPRAKHCSSKTITKHYSSKTRAKHQSDQGFNYLNNTMDFSLIFAKYDSLIIINCHYFTK